MVRSRNSVVIYVVIYERRVALTCHTHASSDLTIEMISRVKLTYILMKPIVASIELTVRNMRKTWMNKSNKSLLLHAWLSSDFLQSVIRWMRKGFQFFTRIPQLFVPNIGKNYVCFCIIVNIAIMIKYMHDIWITVQHNEWMDGIA